MRIKPGRGAFDRTNIAPEWGWFHEQAVSAIIGWESAGAVYDYSSRVLLNGFSSPLIRATPTGLAMNLVGAGDAFQTLAPESVRIPYPLTMFCGFTPTNSSTSGAPIFGVTENDADASPFASYFFQSRGNVRVGVRANQAGSAKLMFNSTGPLFVGGEIMHLAVTLVSGRQEIFNKGASVAVETQFLGTTASFTATSLLTFGAGTFNATQIASGDYHYGYILKGCLTDAQISMVARDPYGMFRQAPLNVGRVPAAVAGRIMSSLVGGGGLVHHGGLAGQGGGLAG